MRPLAILTGLSLLTASLLLGCSGGEANGGASAQAAPAPKPMTPESTAAAAKRYSQDVGPNAGP